MGRRVMRRAVVVAFTCASLVVLTGRGVLAMPAPGALRFIAPTPLDAALVTTGSINVKLDASCTFDPDTLAVSLNGTALPAAGFLPFSACTAGRITSQTVNIALTL